LTIDSRDPIASESSLAGQLKGRGRRRREQFAALADARAPAAPRRNDLLPPLELLAVPLSELRLPARKLRKLDAAHVREVARTIQALGFCVPLLIDKNKRLIDGEICYEATKLLGLPTAPCILIDHLSDDEQRLLRLAVNRLGDPKSGLSLDRRDAQILAGEGEQRFRVHIGVFIATSK
jgi:hypothetical protein